jgi:hypothetical protein
MSVLEEDYGRATTKQWLDQLETIIEQEARLAGFLEHGTSVGDAREFFVRRVLRSVLPPMVHVGRGRVIGAMSKPSKQIDIVIFDPRFPILEIESGMGLYPVEGVIATIEVKSTLNKENLNESLDNCYSVMGVGPHSLGDDITHRTEELMHLKKWSRREAEQWLNWDLQPKTYIFSFTGYKTAEGLASAVQEWYEHEDLKSPRSIIAPYLPRIIASEGVVGLSADNWVFLPQCDDPAKATVMQFIPCEQRFGMFALHLIHAVSERLGTMHAEEGVRYNHEKYFPWEDYLAQGRKQQYPAILLDKK